MKRLILGLCLGLASGLAMAVPATISWVNPTQNVDGTTIPASGPGSLVSVRVEWGSCGSTSTPTAPVFGTRSGERVINMPATTGTFDIPVGATTCFRMTATNTFAEESLFSNVVQRVVPAPEPRPPVLSTTVTIAWEARWKRGQLEMVQVGTVPVGTACGEKTVSLGYATFHEVPLSEVNLQKRGAKNAYSLCG